MNALVFNLYGDPSLSLGSHGDAAVAISLQPSAATITAGSTFQFQASVTGATNTSAVWSVLESAGGSVSASGLYTAPAQAGTYHVRATCGADSSLHADATVTVTGAAEYIEGAVWANGALTFHFTPSAPSSWVDVHYKTSRNAVLQNYRMVLAGSTWGSSTVPSPGLQSGDTVTYSYTYAKPLGAADSPWITQAVGSPLK